MGDKPKAELFDGLRSLYASREYADLKVHLRDGASHRIHKAIVCPRSKYFDQLVKRGEWKDGQEGELELSDDEPEVVRLLLEYVYLLDYQPHSTTTAEDVSSHGSSSDSASLRAEAGQYLYGTSALSAFGGPQLQYSSFPPNYRSRGESAVTVHALPETQLHANYGRPLHRNRDSSRRPPTPSPLATAEPNLVLHAGMYAAGHKYGIDGLKALALDKFKIQLTRHWDSDEFAEAIHVVWNGTPPSDRDMRVTVADTLDLHSRLLDKQEIEFAILEINGLAYELLKRSRRADLESIG